ncbi:MAG: (deoxy)nucleoside triphosphate pyrophosphohydrolase [Muribaculaceae bacterium]|nr:(deoxy)nucleoside triphosphate pyrophosphohydrolase [Muribaculaceae bacterium]
MNKKKHFQVVAAVIVHRGEILCMQKGETRYHYTSGRYEFPGGKIEAGETPQQALCRELLEEMDVRVRVGEHLLTVTHHYPDFSITMQAFLCQVDSRQLVRREHAGHCWLPPQDLVFLNWCAADVPIVQEVMNKMSVI